MYPPILRATAAVWLNTFEYFLLPLRTLAAAAPLTDEEQRELQEDVWSEMLKRRRSTSLEGPIFTDEVVARARRH